MELWSYEKLSEKVAEDTNISHQGAMQLLDLWLRRGDQVLVYQNHDLGSQLIGKYLYISYGGKEALIEKKDYPEPPVTCPDIQGMPPMWAWRLVGGVLPDSSNEEDRRALENEDKQTGS